MISFSFFITLMSALSTGLGFLLCHVLNSGLTVPIVYTSLSVAVALSLVLLKKQKECEDFKLPSWGIFESLITACFLIFSLRQFGWIYFFRDGNILTLDASNFGDLPLHLTYIAQLIRGVKPLFVNPIFPYEMLHYPIGVDLFTAYFVKLGMPLEQTLPILGIILSACLAWALLMWGRGFAVGAFLFSGGFAGFEILSTGVLKDYQAPLAWKNIFLTLLIPQRGFLLAFPMGLWLLWSWRQKYFLNKKGLTLASEVALYSVMPLIHFHTFIFLSFFYALLLIFTKNLKTGVKLIFFSFIPATFFTLKVTENFKQASSLWIESGWLMKDQNLVSFLLQNYGLFFPFTILAFYFSYIQKRKNALLLLSSGLGIFLICCFVMFAPWDWDNTKIMVWCYLLILPVIDEIVIRPLSSRLAKGIVYGIFFFSGVISVWSSYGPSNRGFAVASIEELSGVCRALNKLDPLAIFAAFPTYGHPVSLCGGSIVAGYQGHLWSYGVKSEKTLTSLKTLMLGQEEYKLAADELKIRFIFWGPREQKEYANSQLPELLANKKIAEGNWGKIFDLLKESK
jgi:hypothetical protein